jgi:CRISPR-associated protein Cas1
MQGRILDFSQAAVKLRVRYRRLLVSLDGREIDAVPLDDVAVVLLAHPQISLSLATLQGLTASGAAVVVCDKRSLPSGLLLPLVGHHLSARRTRLQAEVSRPLQKRLWRQIVRRKIEGQADVLETLRGDDGGLRELAAATLSGDSDNREGVAAKRYWAKLFAGGGFRRDLDGGDPTNAALNYGYGVLRAVVARAVVATGLCPAFGLFHRNKYDAFALVDDLMEPFRPTVDVCVARLRDEDRLSAELTLETKSALIRQLTGRYMVEGFQETLFEAAAKAAESLVRAYSGKAKALTLPSSAPLKPTGAEPPTVKTDVVPEVPSRDDSDATAETGGRRREESEENEWSASRTSRDDAREIGEGGAISEDDFEAEASAADDWDDDFDITLELEETEDWDDDSDGELWLDS